MDNPNFIEKLKDHLSKIIEDDKGWSINENERHLMSKIGTVQDLWDFLKENQTIEMWAPSEIFGFVLDLVSGDVSAGISDFSPLSEDYNKAKADYLLNKGSRRSMSKYWGQPSDC